MSNTHASPSSETSWSLATDRLGCHLKLEGGALRCQLERLDVPGLPCAPAQLAALWAEDRPLMWRQGRQIDVPSQGGTRRLAVELVDDRERARLVVNVELFEDRPFVRTSAVLTNSGDQPFTITGAEILRLAIDSNEPHTLFHVEQFSWTYRRDFFSQNQVELIAGRAPAEIRMGSFPSHYDAPTSCAWFALRAGRADRGASVPAGGPGIVAGIEFNGKSRMRAENDATCITISSTIDELAHALGRGGSFELPACFMGCFDGDWDAAGYVTQRFAEAQICPPMPDERYPWVQYNSWKYGQEINEAQQLKVIERCAELGIEVFVVDLGWARQIGDWRPDPEKFPRCRRQNAHETWTAAKLE